MPPEDIGEGSPDEWLRRAKGNLARARQPKPAEAFWEDLCFDAQQAAEKAVKAVLVLRSTRFPYIHDIGELLATLDRAGHEVPDELYDAAAILSPYAVHTRYPGAAPPVSEAEHEQAVALAERVVRWAEQILSGGA